MDNKKIRIDNRCLGKEMLCVGYRPHFPYDAQTGNKGVQDGYAYDITFPEHGFDKLTVKIAGDQQIDLPEGGYVSVTLADLTVRPYVGRDGRLAFSATASAIKAAQTKG